MDGLKNKNDYTCIFFFDGRTPVKYTFVHNVYGLTQTVFKKFGEYKYVNVYVRRTGVYLKRFYYGNFIPPKP